MSKHLNAAKQIIDGILQSIQEAGKDGVPAGTVYTALMSHGCNLQQYEAIERIIIASGQVKKTNNLLLWVQA